MQVHGYMCTLLLTSREDRDGEGKLPVSSSFGRYDLVSFGVIGKKLEERRLNLRSRELATSSTLEGGS